MTRCIPCVEKKLRGMLKQEREAVKRLRHHLVAIKDNEAMSTDEQLAAYNELVKRLDDELQ